MEAMSETTSRIGRTQVGIIAAICLGIAAGCWFFFPQNEALLSAFLRVGIVMTALWFAVPAKGAELAWEKILPILAGGLVLVALAKRVMIVALPLAIAVGVAAYFLRPRHKPKPGERRN
mgnify:FL=1